MQGITMFGIDDLLLGGCAFEPLLRNPCATQFQFGRSETHILAQLLQGH